MRKMFLRRGKSRVFDAQVRNALSISSPQIMDRSEAASAAIDSMEVKHGEPLVVQFAAP